MMKDIGEGRLNIERLLGQSQMIKHTVMCAHDKAAIMQSDSNDEGRDWT